MISWFGVDLGHFLFKGYVSHSPQFFFHTQIHPIPGNILDIPVFALLVAGKFIPTYRATAPGHDLNSAYILIKSYIQYVRLMTNVFAWYPRY